VRNGRVAVAGWLETEDATVDQLVDRFTEAGLSQAIVTEISRDGMLLGPEFALYERLQTKYTDVDFTISGGVSSIDDVVRAGDLGLRRIIIGKAIYEGRITLKQLEHLL
jgi:phosphoribosylformimino-5-aminoimidazole carboxamide ribotide isomerase